MDRALAALVALGLLATACAGTQSAPPPELQLVDVAVEVGLDVTQSSFAWGVTPDPVAMMGGGVCWIDVDADGWLDLFVTDTWADGEWGKWNEAGAIPTPRIFRNVEGRFEEYTRQWGVGFEARAGGCVAADLDGDGFTDLYVTTARENLLLWNQAGTGFVEGATAAGANAFGWQTGVGAGDLNGDGLTDLVVAGYADLNKPRPDASTGFPNTFEPVADVVFVNNGAATGARPTFTNVVDEVGLELDGAEYGLGVVLIDIDNDGDLDLQVANDTQPNRLYLNQAAPGTGAGFKFVDVSAQAGVDDPNSGMGIAVADVNGDLRHDMIVTNLEGQGHVGLLGQSGLAPRFAPGLDSVRELGRRQTGWGASFGDLDLDGDPDLLVASGQIPIESVEASGLPVVMFSNLGGDGGFEEVSTAVGLDEVPARNGRAIALADYDNDGDLDAAISAIGQPLVLLETRGAAGHWLMVDAGVPMPGMVVRVELEDGTVMQRTAMAGGSWLSSEDPRLHFGLGSSDRAVSVAVTFPDGSSKRFEDVDGDQVLRVG